MADVGPKRVRVIGPSVVLVLLSLSVSAGQSEPTTWQLTADTGDVYDQQDVELLKASGSSGQKTFSVLAGESTARWFSDPAWSTAMTVTDDASVTLTFSTAVEALTDIEVTLHRVSPTGSLEALASDAESVLLSILPQALTFDLPLQNVDFAAGEGIALEVAVSGVPVLATLDYGGSDATLTLPVETAGSGGFSFGDITEIDSDLQPVIAAGLILAAFAIAGVALSRFS